MRALADDWELEETPSRGARGLDAVLVCGAFEQQQRVHRALVGRPNPISLLARCSEACAVASSAEDMARASPTPAADLAQLFENDDVLRLQMRSQRHRKA